jgi:hypothetical protein
MQGQWWLKKKNQRSQIGITQKLLNLRISPILGNQFKSDKILGQKCFLFEVSGFILHYFGTDYIFKVAFFSFFFFLSSFIVSFSKHEAKFIFSIKLSVVVFKIYASYHVKNTD